MAQPRTPRAMMAGLTTSPIAVHCGRGRMAMFYRMAIYRNQERSSPIIEDGPDLGDEGGYVPTDGQTEPLDAYADLFGDAKRRKTAE